MGFDVTFHPVSVADLQRFVFDVAADPSLAPKRAKELTSSAAKQKEVLEGVLARLPDFVKDVKRDGGFDQTLAFAAAAIAGYRHPYWYARGSALSFLAPEHPEIAKLVTPLPEIAKGVVGKLDDGSKGWFTQNYAASGVILHDKLAPLFAILKKLGTPARGKKKAPLHEVFDEEGFDSLVRAIAYAAEHDLALMEATDLVVPISNEGFTDPDNMRAHFLDNQNYAAAGPPKAKAAPKKKSQKKTAPKKKSQKKAPAKKPARR